jgi:cell division protein FtsB
MKRKYKMTGCARFFIVLIILAPLAYLGASYYNGENGIENIKNLLGINKEKSSSSPTDTYQNTSKDLQKRVDELETENRKLRREVKEKEAEIKALKNMKGE